MSDTVLEPLPAPVDSPSEDSVCIGCEYNLQGLEEDGLCPECGLPVLQSLRALGGNLRLPGSLRIVSTLLILVGACSVVQFVAELPMYRIELPVGAIGIPAGFGLLRLSNRWRITALVLLGLWVAKGILVLLASVVTSGSPTWEVLGLPLASVPQVYVIAFGAAILVVNVWMLHILRRPQLRAMMRVLGPRMHRIRPGLLARFRWAMALICGGCVAFSLLLVGCLLWFADSIDPWLLKQSRTIRSQSSTVVQKANAGDAVSPQITVELDSESDEFSFGGDYLSSVTTQSPLTGRMSTEGIVTSKSGIKCIDSKDYCQIIVSGRDKKPEDVNSRALDWLHRLDRAAGEFDIRLVCRVPTEITFENGENTTVTNLKSNRVLTPPYVLEPGEYHLRATTTAPGVP